MCVMSMVHDHFLPKIEPFLPKVPIDAQPWPFAPGFTTTTTGGLLPFLTLEEIATVREIIARFREASAAAAKVDVLTSQPDCVDPEKAKLMARIDELEAELKKRGAPKRKKARRVSKTVRP